MSQVESCLGTHGDGLDEIWDECSDFLHALLPEGVVVVVDPELTHEEERSAKEILALCSEAFLLLIICTHIKCLVMVQRLEEYIITMCTKTHNPTHYISTFVDIFTIVIYLFKSFFSRHFVYCVCSSRLIFIRKMLHPAVA